MSFGFIQNVINSALNTTDYVKEKYESCWFKEYVSKRKCINDFDFSDHIVLLIVQYVFIMVLELAFIAHKLSLSNIHGSKWVYGLYYISLAAVATILMLSFRGIFFTALFFHTPAENIVALILALMFSFAPIIYSRPIRLIISRIITPTADIDE